MGTHIAAQAHCGFEKSAIENPHSPITTAPIAAASREVVRRRSAYMPIMPPSECAQTRMGIPGQAGACSARIASAPR